MGEIMGAFWEELLAAAGLLIVGLICIGKGFRSLSKVKKLETFLMDDKVEQVKGLIRVVKVRYHYRQMNEYIVKITFKNWKDELMSVTKSFNGSRCYAAVLRKSKKKGEVPVTIFYHKEDPENLIIQELREITYFGREKWIVPFFGIVFILLGIALIYYRLRLH
ncbi:hypothetical protein EII17_00060 [Clostridiales bacterium COT073_COT-073]|nr:hypothetical protein EII17_00060 [Clostridiales bacterium COT073_COT-073]